MPETNTNSPIEHHYVPQFYMRRFACIEDRKKVVVVERYLSTLVGDRKSIERIGYEDHLHEYVEDGVSKSIEGDLNAQIETPFSNGATWSKIVAGRYEVLDRDDGLSIYGFARHLQRRNLTTLRFLEKENARYRAGELGELDPDERAAHAWIAERPDRSHQMFRDGAMDLTLPADAHAINIMVCRSPIPFRTTTNPTLIVSYPGVESIFGAMFGSLRTWWLSLDRHCGAFIIAGGPPGMSVQDVSGDVARVVNRSCLTQMLHGEARYLIADDDHVASDLEWAGFELEKPTTHGFRYRATSWQPPSAGGAS